MGEMEASRNNKKQQTQAVDFGKFNEAFANEPTAGNEKLDKIDDFFENNAQVSKTIVPSQPPFHEPAKPMPQQQLADIQL
jgi:hypothetical protein